MTDDLPPGSWTVLGLRSDLWHCQFDNFRWDEVAPKGLKQVVRAFIDQTQQGNAPHLILTGDPGIGKSHLGVAVYRWGVTQYGSQLCTWLNVPDFCDTVKRAYNDSSDPFEDFREARKLVVLDDLFGRDLSVHELGQIVYRLIDIAYTNGAAVVANMNNDVKDLATYLKPHEVSRLLARSKVVPMRAVNVRDQRRTKW